MENSELTPKNNELRAKGRFKKLRHKPFMLQFWAYLYTNLATWTKLEI